MTIAESKLATRHPAVMKEIEQLALEAQKLGASEGVQRLSLVCNQYDKLSPDATYRLIDPGAFQREVEEAQGRKVEIWHIIRNCISLFPLILTWFALFSATNSYQACATAPAGQRCDLTQPFLTLWEKDGFGGRTFQFSVAALLDVMLLLLYLSFILLTYVLDRRAHTISTSFSEQLQTSTENLMRVVGNEGITPIASDADVDRVAGAVQQVVEKAVQMSEQIAQTAQQSIEQLVQAVQQSSQEAVTVTQQSNQQTLAAIQQSAQQSLEAAQQTNQQTVLAVQQAAQQMSQTAQQTIEQVTQAVQQSNQQSLQAIEQTTQQILAASQQSSEQIMQAARQAINESNSKIEALMSNQVTPLLTTFNSDMVKLHSELGNYQNRLNDLTTASKQLASASGTLVSNADRYVAVGQDISTQITALNATQQQVLAQIAAIAGNISSAASDMSAATSHMHATTSSMEASTKAVEAVASQLSTGMQVTINTMTSQVGRATQSLGQVGTELQTTTYHLQKAAVILSSLQFASRGGLIGWFFNRWSHRRKTQEQGV